MGMRIVVPPVGWAQTGIVREWYKDDGDWISVGAQLCAIQMGMRTHAVSALDNGFLRLGLKKQRVGMVVARGDLLGLIVAPGESSEIVGRASPSMPARMKFPPARQEHLMKLAIAAKPDRRRISPRARRAAREAGIRWHDLRGSGHDGRIIAHDVETAARLRPPKPSSGLAQLISGSATFTVIDENNGLVFETAVDQLLIRALQLLKRRSISPDSVCIGMPRPGGLRYAAAPANDSMATNGMQSLRTSAHELVPLPDAQWLLIDVASYGLESFIMPLAQACHGMLVIGRDASTLRASVVANPQHVLPADVLEMLRELVGTSATR